MTSTLSKQRSNVHSKLWMLGILNCTDIFFTYILINGGVCYEANKIMNDILSSTYNCIALKIAIPTLLLIYLGNRLKEATDKQINISNKIMNIVIILYVLINISHCMCSIFIL